MNRCWTRPGFQAACGLLFSLGLCASSAVVYEVGPTQPFSAIGQVPWETLQPGDTVLIHWRPEPYREKWVICRQGKVSAPITVRGVPGPGGELPVIEGNGATTRTNLNYWGDVRSVIKIGGAQNPPDTMPQYLVLESLDIRNGRPPYKFTGADGKERAYIRNAAAIRVEKAEHLTIRNCALHDCGNGLFVSSNDKEVSKDILVEGNYIYDNGNARSGQEHNVYTEASGITFQFNRLGPLRAGCSGINLKDRSAKLVVRYNWIEGGNKQLDLVDAEDSSLIRNDPEYRRTFVYGNVLISLNRIGQPYIVHYGGDSAKVSNYRKGTLYFYHNTVVSIRRTPTVLFRISSDEESCECWNNILHISTTPKTRLAIVENKGVVRLSHNWLQQGWRTSTNLRATNQVHDDGTSMTGDTPGFADPGKQDFHLTPDSPCRGRGAALDIEPFRSHPVEWQYVKHQTGAIRASDGAPSLGAFAAGARSGKQ